MRSLVFQHSHLHTAALVQASECKFYSDTIADQLLEVKSLRDEVREITLDFNAMQPRSSDIISKKV